MARIPVPSKVIRGFQYVLENDFTGGLKTEFTGLNFPENACTSTENCTFFHTGAIFRRNGFDYESNFTTSNINRTNLAISTFVWTNAGGDGNTKILVVQVGGTLYFYQITNATISSPLSTTLLGTTVTLGANTSTIECQFAAGNGYLFVFHPNMDPIYCTFNAGIITSFNITIKIRDFIGIPEPGVPDNLRPASLSAEHTYNLQNQGWTQGSAWSATSNTTAIPLVCNNSFSLGLGLNTFIVQPGISGVTVGQGVAITGSIYDHGYLVSTITAGGLVNSYSGTSLVLNVTSSSAGAYSGCITNEQWTIVPSNTGYINTWFTGVGNYPSNADQWWAFKNASGVFSPSTTVNNVTLDTSPAPKGFYIMSAFTQQRSTFSAVAGLTDVTTTARPRTGTWFQGRVWYAGVDSSFNAIGDEPFSTWTENIYFSQIVTSTANFAKCYQTNDPTSETLFDILPSDGGVITIQGSGSIYKLFPITNGLLVFAANGIWFITGSTGIGFTATDYTISKLSAIQSISSTSYVDVLGYPLFWNEEGIYSVNVQSEQQGLSVNSLTLNTIKQFYDAIPKQSKKFARGSYNPITGQVQWIYRSTNESTITDRYQFDSMLTFSMFTQAFYPWNISNLNSTGLGLNKNVYIHDVTYIVGPGGSTSPFPVFKYLNSFFDGVSNYTFSFAEEKDNVNWVDWHITGYGSDYTSFFVTGYRLHGDAQRKFQPMYVFMYSDNLQNTSYKFNGKWNFALSPNSGKVSTVQVITNTVNTANFGKLYRRHRLRGRGTVLQLQIASVSGKPFHIDGWALAETQTQGV